MENALTSYCIGQVNNVRVGTQRYMAPEILEGTININLMSYMSSDVYALSLVMWEVLSQCPKFESDGISPISYDPAYSVPQYCLPFTAELKNEMPTLEKMTHIVCEKKVRPRPQAWWILNEVMDLWLSGWILPVLSVLCGIDIYMPMVTSEFYLARI